MAKRFAAEGADVVISDVAHDVETIPYGMGSEKDLHETAALVRALGRRCVAEVADVRNEEDMARVVRNAIAELGHIDIVVANAGVYAAKSFWDISQAEWDEMIAINLTGAWQTTKAVAPHMMERLTGVVIYSASINAVEGATNFLHYAAAKHGVLGIMRSAALELAPFNIRVNAVLPGPVDSPMHNNQVSRGIIGGRPDASREDVLSAVLGWNALRGRTMLPPDAIANAVVWLASDQAEHITGLELKVDAGHGLLPGMNMSPINDESIMSVKSDFDHGIR
ncbi:MAG: Short-chain dehydrogenase/reductase [Naasia sp.]|nr:Short-chain dehydrogenase/reductase [Naasia sp.]